MSNKTQHFKVAGKPLEMLFGTGFVNFNFELFGANFVARIKAASDEKEALMWNDYELELKQISGEPSKMENFVRMVFNASFYKIERAYSLEELNRHITNSTWNACRAEELIQAKDELLKFFRGMKYTLAALDNIKEEFVHDDKQVGESVETANPEIAIVHSLNTKMGSSKNTAIMDVSIRVPQYEDAIRAQIVYRYDKNGNFIDSYSIGQGFNDGKNTNFRAVLLPLYASSYQSTKRKRRRCPSLTKDQFDEICKHASEMRTFLDSLYAAPI